MRVIMFKEQFAEAVREGLKQQTVRARARCKPGDTLSLRRWTGKPYRSKQEILFECPCTHVFPVTIFYSGSVAINDYALTAVETEAFAKCDGFADSADMFAWFEKTHKGRVFHGDVIFWEHVPTWFPPELLEEVGK